MNNCEHEKLLSALFSGTAGLVELLAIHKDTETVVTHKFERDLTEICKEVNRIADHANCYYGVTTKKRESGDKESAYEIVGFWADLDFKDFAGGEKEARERLSKFQFKPSIIICSGGGLHCYWLFLYPEIIGDHISWYEGANRGIAARLGGDDCWDMSKRLRLPGTTNYPTARKRAGGRTQPSPCVIEVMSDLRYNPEDFKGLHKEGGAVAQIISIDSASFEAVKAKLDGDLESDALLKNTWEGFRPDIRDQSRSGFDMALANLLARRNYSPEEIKSILPHNPSGKGTDATDSYLDLTVSKAIASYENDGGQTRQPVISSALEQFIIPFDAAMLPEFLKDYLAAVGNTTASPDEFIILAAIAAFSAAIGTRSHIKVGPRLYHPTIWGINVAQSSIQYKSTGNDLARPLLKWKEDELEKRFIDEMEIYKMKMRGFEALKKTERISQAEPVMPVREEIIFADDETMESKYQTLHDSPKGGVAFYDEVAGFVGSFDRYSSGSGGVEIHKWLSVFDNRAFKYKRKKDKTLLSVNCPFTSLIGATTIEGLKSFYTTTNDAIGFLPRFLFNFCPQQVKPDATFLKPDVDGRLMGKLIAKTAVAMRMNEIKFTLSPQALELFEAWYVIHNTLIRSESTPEWVRAYWKRLESYCLKFALIYQVFESDKPEVDTVVDVDKMKKAMCLVDYFKGQVVKLGLYFNSCANTPDKEWWLTLRVANVLKLKGNIEPREIQRAIHGSPPVEQVKMALERLKRVGFM